MAFQTSLIPGKSELPSSESLPDRFFRIIIISFIKPFQLCVGVLNKTEIIVGWHIEIIHADKSAKSAVFILFNPLADPRMNGVSVDIFISVLIVDAVLND